MVKALVKQIIQEIRSVFEKLKKGERASLPKPRKLSKVHKLTIPTNPNMVVDKRKLKRGKGDYLDVKISWYEDAEVVFRISYEAPKAQRELKEERSV